MLHRTDDYLLTHQPTVKTNGNGHKARPQRPPLTATQAALIAVALVNGKVSAKQACQLTGACHAYFALVAAMDDAKRDALSRGKFTLSGIVNGKTKRNGNGNGGHSTESLIDRLRRADAAELVAAVREFGVGKFFDVAIVPTLENQDEVIVASTGPVPVVVTE
jgi:hypothetical protein